MLAARAEGIGSTLTGMLQSYFADEVMDILGVPKDMDGEDRTWYMHGCITMGYAPANGVSLLVRRSRRWPHAIAGTAS